MTIMPSVHAFCMHTFLGGLLSDQSVVVDLGANRGEFAHAMVRRFGCTVHAVEPVPSRLEEIADDERIIKHQVCIAPESGTAILSVAQGRDARLADLPTPPSIRTASRTIQIEAPARRLEDFLSDEGITAVDLLKVDIEGAEVSLLAETPPPVLTRIRQITVEFHDWLWPNTTREVERVIARLRSLDFRFIRFSRNNGDVLFVRRDLIGPLQYAYIKVVVKSCRGVARVVRRRLAHSL